MFQKKSQPILLIFIAVNLFGFLVQKGLLHANLKINFLLVVNGMLLLMYFFNLIRISKLDKTNPNAMVRSVMIGTLLKMIVFVDTKMQRQTGPWKFFEPLNALFVSA